MTCDIKLLRSRAFAIKKSLKTLLFLQSILTKKYANFLQFKGTISLGFEELIEKKETIKLQIKLLIPFFLSG